MKISINFGLAKSIEDIRMLSSAYLRGIIMKPNITKLSKAISADKKTVGKALNTIKAKNEVWIFHNKYSYEVLTYEYF